MGQLGRQNAPTPFDTYKKAEADAINGVQDATNTAQDVVIAQKEDTTDVDAKVAAAAAEGVPVGQIIYHAGTTAPTGFLVCDGSEISETIYADLFAAIGTSWNTTGGAAAPAGGNFRIPPSQIGNLGLYMRGVGATNGAVGTYQPDVFKSHSHRLYNGANAASSWATQGNNSNGYQGSTEATGDATETRPRSLTVLMCIKY